MLFFCRQFGISISRSLPQRSKMKWPPGHFLKYFCQRLNTDYLP